MPDFTRAPREVRDLADWLRDHGYEPQHDAPGGEFNQFVVLGNANVRVAIRADRGDWDVTLSIDEGRRYWQIDQLEAYLEGCPWVGDPSSDLHKASFVKTRVAELEQRVHDDPEAYATLLRIGDEWMSWRFGIPIPDGGFPRGLE